MLPTALTGPVTRSAYGYAANSPINRVDPWGLCSLNPFSKDNCIGKVVIGAGGAISDVVHGEWDVDWGSALAASTNIVYGGAKTLLGGAIIIASPECLAGAVICAGFGVYMFGTGGARTVRGIGQLLDFANDPSPPDGYCSTGDNLSRFVRGIIPGGDGSWFDWLGGLP